jgi:hypothetical protein
MLSNVSVIKSSQTEFEEKMTDTLEKTDEVHYGRCQKQQGHNLCMS